MKKEKLPAISLIIPVFNVEKFLRTALDSVVAQTFQDFEAIIINDGSTDASANIISEYANKHKIFKVINQSNQGLGVARNVGLKVAKGKYLAFMDSDDFINPKFLETLYNTAMENDADISYCNFNFYFEKNEMKFYMPLFPMGKIYSSEKALKRLILDINFRYFIWNKLFKRSLFMENNLQFYSMYFEDIAICPELFFRANKIAATSKALYYYRRHDLSSIAVMTDKQINDFAISLGILRNFLEKHGIYKRYKNQFLIYALRARFQMHYCVLFEHLRNKNFEGLLENIKAASISANLFMDKNYKPTQQIPILPCYVKSPKNKKDNKKIKKIKPIKN